MDQRIKIARRRVLAAKSALRRTLREVQASCTHPVAYHRDGSPNMFGRIPAARLCASCGYEEMNRWGDAKSWSDINLCDRFGNDLPYGTKSKLAKAALHVLTSDEYSRRRMEAGL